MIRALPVLSTLAALGFAPSCAASVLGFVDTWVAGLSPLATDAQRAAAIGAMEGLLPVLAANGVDSLDESAAHVAVLMQPHEATAGLLGAGLLRLAADVQIEGTPVLTGQTVLLVLASAPRDASVHDAPEEFRLNRSQRSPLPLGAGVHACPGGPAALAVAECAWRHVTAYAGADGLQARARDVTWRTSVNARIPLFA